ncbi:MAG: hypothetical protein Q7J98_08890 [Kiritimatiellia bacterium]|nr:hypothetical protein [Kiritimatiellia bacterium]
MNKKPCAIFLPGRQIPRPLPLFQKGGYGVQALLAVAEKIAELFPKRFFRVSLIAKHSPKRRVDITRFLVRTCKDNGINGRFDRIIPDLQPLFKLSSSE